MRTFLTFIGLGCAATILVVSLSETQQNATDTLSSYKRDGPSVLLHDERLKEVTRRNPYMRDERWAAEWTPNGLISVEELAVADDPEIVWHKEQIARNRAVLEELEAGNTTGGDIFPETQAEIDRLRAQIAQSELIVAAYHKDNPEMPWGGRPQAPACKARIVGARDRQAGLMAVRNVRFGLIPWSRNAPRQGMFREAALTLLQGPQFSSWEFCHIGRPHRIAALAIGTLKSSATDVLAEQVLHGLAALGADRGRGIFRHVAHADRGESTTELTVTGNCRGWAVMGGLIIGFVFKARQGDQGFKQASGA